MNMQVLLIIAFIFAPQMARSSCQIGDIQNFWQRVKKDAPFLEVIKQQKEQARASVDIAKQRPNPEISMDYKRGDQFGVEVNTFSLSAQHIYEFGDKRDKRVNRAQVESELGNVALNFELFQLKINSVVSYQKLAQLEIVTQAMDEAIRTFEKIIKKLERRSRLNPEEQVSLSTLRLALNDYRARQNDLENEKNLLEGKIGFLVGCQSLSPHYSLLKYDQLSLEGVHNKKLGVIGQEKRKLKLSELNYEVEKSLGYSNIAIGPTVEYQNEGVDEFVSGGVAISFALPLFHTNDGGKLRAMKNMAAQKQRTKNNIELINIRRQRLIQKYNRSLKTIKQMPSLKELEKKHQQVEKLFSRGIVSMSMTIESHRQQVDFLESRFETENDLLETIGEISLIDGNLDLVEAIF